MNYIVPTGKTFVIIGPPKKSSEPEVEQKCAVCGDWIRIGFYHNTCYQPAPPGLPPPLNSNEILIED